MKKISTLLNPQKPQDGFPMLGINGYAGEQDNSKVVLSLRYSFASRAKADAQFPEGIPDYVQLHWATFTPGRGWEAVFGWWDNQPDEHDGNPLITA